MVWHNFLPPDGAKDDENPTFRQNLRNQIFEDEEMGIKKRIQIIRQNPLIPSYIQAYGFLDNLFTKE